MARTKASVGAKVSSGKSSKARCSVAPPSTSAGSSGGGDKAARSHSGGNSVCHRETPKWQKPITNFFICKDPSGDKSLTDEEDGATAGSSKAKPKRNVIESDGEDEQPTNGESELKQIANGEDEQKDSENGEDEHGQVKPSDVNGNDERPTNHALDETIELAPLNGEDSHKIDEYYSKNSKGKGKGKKTKGKENLDLNVERRSSLKRDLEEVTSSEDSSHASKKVKVQ